MKTSLLKGGLVSLALLATPAGFAQQFGIVGYYNRPVFPGDNLIANQLIQGNQTLDAVLANGLPTGATLTKWNATTQQLLPASTFDATSSTWSINYTLDLGEGAILHLPSAGTVTFVGGVYTTYESGADISPWPAPNRDPGLYLISYGQPMNASFQDVIGRAPQEGEWVQVLDEAHQSYSRTTFHTSLGWDNGAPNLTVGQSAWFDLGPVAGTVPDLVPVPEPSVMTLLGLGSLGVLTFRRRHHPG